MDIGEICYNPPHKANRLASRPSCLTTPGIRASNHFSFGEAGRKAELSPRADPAPGRSFASRVAGMRIGTWTRRARALECVRQYARENGVAVDGNPTPMDLLLLTEMRAMNSKMAYILGSLPVIGALLLAHLLV